MKIACLGWGSLVWDSRELDIPQDKWLLDGPTLPVEFSRISDNKRVTLIIDRSASWVPVLWSPLRETNLPTAQKLLATRESPRLKLLSIVASIQAQDKSDDPIEKSVINWLNEKGLDAAIWTALSFSKQTGGSKPSIEFVIAHLNNLRGKERDCAEEYIRRTPPQIKTEYREKIVKAFDWFYKPS